MHADAVDTLFPVLAVKLSLGAFTHQLRRRQNTINRAAPLPPPSFGRHAGFKESAFVILLIVFRVFCNTRYISHLELYAHQKCCGSIVDCLLYSRKGRDWRTAERRSPRFFAAAVTLSFVVATVQLLKCWTAALLNRCQTAIFLLSLVCT